MPGARVVSCLLAALIASAPAVPAGAARERRELPEKIDAILSDAYAPDRPGAAVVVVRGEQTVYRKAFGMANLELGVPLTADMVFRLGSITKQFTAAAILMLEEQGKLSLDDPITRFLPDYPVHGHTITVEHLLTHTSGIRSYTNLPGWMESRIVSDMTPEELVDGFKSEPMEFAPGERYNYYNSAYVLLGVIIEKVSGKAYADFIQERIFDPLGMKHSFYGSRSRIIPNRASGYDGRPGAPENARYLSMTQPYSAGSLLSTVDDLALWNRALFSGKLLGAKSVERMVTPRSLADGSSTGYGYGLAISEIRGHRAIHHGGGIFGFATSGIYLPDDDVYVALLSNTSAAEARPETLAQKIAALVAGDPYPEWTPVALAPEVLEGYVGVYRIDEETTRSVTAEDGRLYTQRSGGPRLEALPASDVEFFYENSLTYFEMVKNGDGQITAMRMYPEGNGEAEEAVRTDERPAVRHVVEVPLGTYDAYVGRYELAPGFILTISREGDRLMSQATGQSKVEIFPTSATEFFLKVVDAQITFVRNEDGTVDRLILNQGSQRLTGLRVE